MAEQSEIWNYMQNNWVIDNNLMSSNRRKSLNKILKICCKMITEIDSIQ